MRSFCFIPLIASLAAEPIPLFLDEDPGANTITIQANINDLINDTVTAIYTGNLLVDLVVGDEGVTQFQMTGGTISATDTTFTFELTSIFTQDVSLQDLKASPVSPSGPEILIPANQFSGTDHYLLFNRGLIVTEGTFQNDQSLVSDSPFTAAGDSTGSITAGPLSEARSSITNEIIGTGYPINLSLPLNSDATYSDGGITLLTNTFGSVTASGILMETYAHPFFAWASANAPLAGRALAFAADADHDGQEDGISWALGFPPGRAAKVLQPTFNPATNQISVILPGPSRAILRLEQSATLTDDWEPVAGFTPLPIGSTGIITLPAPASTPLFYRFTASLE